MTDLRLQANEFDYGKSLIIKNCRKKFGDLKTPNLLIIRELYSQNL